MSLRLGGDVEEKEVDDLELRKTSMTTDRPADYLVSLVRELCKLPQETEWVEFKVNDAEPQQIGEYFLGAG